MQEKTGSVRSFLGKTQSKDKWKIMVDEIKNQKSVESVSETAK